MVGASSTVLARGQINAEACRGYLGLLSSAACFACAKTRGQGPLTGSFSGLCVPDHEGQHELNHACMHAWMDGWVDGWMHGWTDGWTE